MLHLFMEDWALWPIAAVLIVELIVIAERLIFLFGAANINREQFVASMQKRILAGDVQGALQVCSAQQRPLSRIVQSGLAKAGAGAETMQSAMDEQALNEIPRIVARTGYLALLANLAMLFGLLGTVWGLIKSFGAVSAKSVDATQKAAILAGGISTAMHCTLFGLAVAILGLIGFAILMGKTQKLEDDIHSATVDVFNLVVANKDKIPQAAVQHAA
jgi:biopolymer transport protein ExbB/TolQ